MALAGGSYHATLDLHYQRRVPARGQLVYLLQLVEDVADTEAMTLRVRRIRVS